MDKIEEINRRNGVASVRLLSGDTLKIPSALYLERRLRVGQPLDPEEYRLFMRQRGYPHALDIAVSYLALRERSVQEVRARLKRSCYDDATIARVLDTLSLHEIVSDARFAEQWVTARARRYGKGRIAQELRQKGVGREEAQAALAALDEQAEYQSALTQAEKISRRLKNDEMKIAQALVRRGYGWAIARKAAEACRARNDREQ